MTVRIYHNHDTSAPVLSATAGSLISLLDAVLVNGYGSKPALGWTKVFSGTNIAVYRNDPSVPGSTGAYLRVDDTNSNYASVRMYKTMSNINTGTDRIPNPAVSGIQAELYWHKHYSGTSTPKRWTIMGDGRTFIINVNTAGAYPSDQNDYNTLGIAGDYESFVPGNDWAYILTGSASTSATSGLVFPMTAGSASARTAVIGRSGILTPEGSTWVFSFAVGPPGTDGNGTPGGPGLPNISIFTGLRSLSPGIIGEGAGATAFPTGRLRGTYWSSVRSSSVWFENIGKLPDDPTGPDLRQLLNYAHSSQFASLNVLEDNWDG